MSNDKLQIRVVQRDELPADGDYTIGLNGYYEPEFALEAGEQVCYSGNRLTAPRSGIETRDTVMVDEEGRYHSLIFPIVLESAFSGTAA